MGKSSPISAPASHNTVCAGCHACQPERFPNTSAAYCGCRVCNPAGHKGELGMTAPPTRGNQ